MKQISILGCGWLGLPLAESLLENGFQVNGSTTSESKIELLKEASIQPFLIQLEEDRIVGEMNEFLKDSTILIIDIPPKLKGNSDSVSKAFVKKIQILIPFIERSSVEKVLFVSSTSVYSDDNSIITEDILPQPDSESGKQLLEAESQLKNNRNFQTTVLRFGGLIGEDRHPIHFLSGKKNIQNPEAPINLIHQKDGIGIIISIIQKSIWQETFNAVAPYHPTRKDYYSQKAIEMNLPLPEFNQNETSVGKTIRSEKIKKILGYEFQVRIN